MMPLRCHLPLRKLLLSSLASRAGQDFVPARSRIVLDASDRVTVAVLVSPTTPKTCKAAGGVQAHAGENEMLPPLGLLAAGGRHSQC